MQQTIFAILTNKAVRNNRIVEEMLDLELIVGAPWRGDATTNHPPAKPDVVS